MSLKHQPEEIIYSRYQVIDILGQGSSGITYRVKDLNTQKQVALKALSLNRLKDWKQIELFEREAEVLANLNHPAIPQYLDYFQVDTPDNRAFYLAQTLAPGKSLSAWVESGWHTTEKDIKNIAEQILSVLGYLHSLEPSVIHRDLKPQNIILSQDGKIFLVDFGAVQNTYYNTLMQGSTVVGTYGYMAPEQFRGRAVPATDLYSLGATLLYLLTNRSPAELPQDTLKLDFRASVNISEEFADWLDKILEPSLQYRYKSVDEALAELNIRQETKPKKFLEIKDEEDFEVATIVLFVFFILPAFLMAYFSVLTEMSSYSPHWRVLSKLGYHPLNVCHSYKGMNHYIRSGGRLDIAVTSRSGDLKQLSECTLASKDNPNLYNQAVFNQAARANELETVQLLINKAVDINFQSSSRDFTALHWAIYNDNPTMVMLLLEQEADANIIGSHPFSNDGEFDYPTRVTPISLAFEQNNHSITQYLIDDIKENHINHVVLSRVKSAVIDDNIEFIRLISNNKTLVRNLGKNMFYDYQYGYISIVDLADFYGSEEMINLVNKKFSK